MNSTQLRCFMAAAENMNFTRAAEQLFITQPALSRNISSLEEELGLLLFVRQNNTLHITPGGQILYDWLKTADDNWVRALDSAKRANASEHQALRIGFVRSELPSDEVAAAIKCMVKNHPGMELFFDHFHSGDIIEKLEEHTMDVAVMIGSAAEGHARLMTKKLAGLKRCVVVPNYHLLADRTGVSLKECAKETFVSVKPEVSPTLSAMVRKMCHQNGFEPKIIEAESTEEQLQWIVSGKGIGLLVENHVKRNNPLYVFLELEEETEVDLVCVWDRLNTNPHIQSFLECFPAGI